MQMQKDTDIGMNKDPTRASEDHGIICGECKKVLVEGPEPVSHTWCSDCRDKVLKEAQEFKDEKH